MGQEMSERVSHSRQIVGLDLVRFAAACLVMFFHFGFWMWAGPAESITSRAAGVSVRFPELTFLSFGRVGVEIFFVISGFIIAYSAERASASQFFRSRVVRLAPAVWIVAPITFAVALLIDFAAPSELSLRLFRSLIFYPFGPWIDGIYWTLPVEIVL